MTASKAVKRLGIDHCQLCGKDGLEENPLTVHRWRCHTFADAVTQEYMHRGSRCTWAIIKRAYRHFIPII